MIELKSLINCRGHLSRFQTLRAQSLESEMPRLLGKTFDLAELQLAVGRELAVITRNEDACVVSGAAAGVVVAMLACLSRGEPVRERALGRKTLSEGSVIVHRLHRVPADRSLSLLPVQVIEIGDAFGAHADELREALLHRPAAIVYLAGAEFEDGAVPLSDVISEGKRAGVPVIVDAAGLLPPVETLWKYTEAGADLVVVSGSKDLRGPAASGLILGSRNLIEACRSLLCPNFTVARAFKVGIEQVVGTLVAVRAYLQQDIPERERRWHGILQEWADRFSSIPGVRVWQPRLTVPATGCGFLAIAPDACPSGRSWDTMVSLLWSGDPRVAVAAMEQEQAFRITPVALEEGEAAIVGKLIERLLRSR